MSKSKNSTYTSYEVITQEADNGDILIPLPPILLSKLGWKEDDKIEIKLDESGRFVFTKSKQ
jgi:hypothetical protein